MGVFRKTPRQVIGEVPLGDDKEYRQESTQAHSVELQKPEVAKKTKRRPHSVAFQKKPLS